MEICCDTCPYSPTCEEVDDMERQHEEPDLERQDWPDEEEPKA